MRETQSNLVPLKQKLITLFKYYLFMQLSRKYRSANINFTGTLQSPQPYSKMGSNLLHILGVIYSVNIYRTSGPVLDPVLEKKVPRY